MTNNYSTAETEIRASIEQWAEAMRTSKLDDIVKHYSDDVVAYDAIGKLQFVGKADYTEHWRTCITYAPDGMVYEIKDLVIHTEGNLAFSYNLASCGCYDENGNVQASWMRVSRCYRKINSKWLAVHEHFSTPFDMDSGKALFDLQP